MYADAAFVHPVAVGVERDAPSHPCRRAMQRNEMTMMPPPPLAHSPRLSVLVHHVQMGRPILLFSVLSLAHVIHCSLRSVGRASQLPNGLTQPAPGNLSIARIIRSYHIAQVL